jgi:hypothetical protein
MGLSQGRINLLLGSLVLVLAMLLLFGPEPDTGEDRVPVTRLDPGQVQRISRKGPGGQSLTLERRGGDWHMLVPYPVPADPTRVRGLLAIAEQPSRTRFAAATEELADFGLAPPSILLELDGAKLGFGRTDPVYFRRFVLHRRQVHLIDDHAYRYLIAPPESFVSRRLLAPGEEILGIRAPGSGLSQAARRRGQDRAAVQADPKALSRIWQEARALEVRKATADSGGNTIELRLQGAERPLVFVQSPTRPDLLVRPDLGLGYRLPADSALLKLLRVTPESEGPSPAESRGSGSAFPGPTPQ